MRTLTYNQSHCILNTLNTILSQQTDFQFISLVIDDASTDGEQSVLWSFAEKEIDHSDPDYKEEEVEDAFIIFGRSRSNANCFFKLVLLKYNYWSLRKSKFAAFPVDSEYIAMCEGDDYWISNTKLQKQVLYLETHDNVNICTHNSFISYPDGSRKPFNTSVKTGVYSMSKCLRMKWFTPTASFLYRNNFTLSPLWAANRVNGDMSFLFSNLMKGDLFYDEEIMSVYNYSSPGSLSGSTPRSVLYQKKKNMYRTIDTLSDHKYRGIVYYELAKLSLKSLIWRIISLFR